jgi:hypothetical protein
VLNRTKLDGRWNVKDWFVRVMEKTLITRFPSLKGVHPIVVILGLYLRVQTAVLAGIRIAASKIRGAGKENN